MTLIFVGCGTETVNNNIVDTTKLEYSKLFSIDKLDSCTLVSVVNPWDSTKLLSKYVLVHKDSILPTTLPEGKLVRTPVEKVAAYSAVDVGVLVTLGVDDKIVALCEPNFIKLLSIDERVAAGEIIDLGSSSKPNIEKLLMANCDVIFTNPMQNTNYGLLAQTNVVLAESVSYMEQDPLGRSEWIKFYAVFFDKTNVADSIFTEIENRYNDLKAITSKITLQKTILSEKRYGQGWWVPGGGSYAAKIFEDAGGKYFWKDTKNTGSLQLSFEEVFIKAAKADHWFIRYYKKGNDLTLTELKSEYESYSLFDAYKNKTIYGCNTATSSYYVFSSTRPEKELSDISKILYPEYFEDSTTEYYKQLKD